MSVSKKTKIAKSRVTKEESEDSDLDNIIPKSKKVAKKSNVGGLKKQLEDQMLVLKKAVNSNTGKGVHPFVHIYKRQGMYIGSKTGEVSPQWIVSPTSFGEEKKDMIVKKPIKYNQGLERIIMEILSNCKDNYWESEKHGYNMTYIKISIDRDSGEISMENDGVPIPVVLTEYAFENPVTGTTETVEKYPAEKFFGDVNFGTNLEKETEKKKSSGLNGLGGKLTNIFSTSFKINIQDAINQKKFEMTFSGNGLKRTKPKVTDYKGKKSFTRITFTPDYKFFGIEADEGTEIVDDDLYFLIKKHAYDAAFILPGLKVDFCGEKIIIKNIEKYVRMFFPDEEESPIITFKALNGDEGCIVQSVQGEYLSAENLTHVSFINGIRTAIGGVHVNSWEKLIFTTLKDFYNSRKKKFHLKDYNPFFKHIAVFLRCETFDHVDFDSQNKEKLVAPKPFKMHGKLDEKPAVQKDMIEKFKNGLTKKLKAVMDWKCIEIMDLEFSEREVVQKAVRGFKRHTDDCSHATLAGPWNPKIVRPRYGLLAEGKSAKNLGESLRNTLPNGKDDWGIQALRGKINNAEKMSSEEIDRASTLEAIRVFYGLQRGVDYSIEANRKKLNYDYGLALTDADDDGIHIQALIIACLSQFKGLLESGFFGAFNTFNVILMPKKKGGEPIFFYSQKEYNSWRESKGKEVNMGQYSITYYKGLGSYEPNMEKYHINPEHRKIVSYTKDNKDGKVMDMAFKNDKTEKQKRKEWIWDYLKSGKETKLCPTEGSLKISTFINNLLVDFHKTSVIRAIPSLLDGFKQVGRQIMYTGLEHLGINKKTQMTSFIGLMMTKAFYHHGPDPAWGAIVSAAQGMPGSNNIPYIRNIGKYGDRKDRKASAARYLAVQFDEIAKAVFREEDNPLLVHTESSGEEAEWVTYLPVVCNLLINGAEGVATGFTTKIACYNPKDIVDRQRQWIQSEDRDSLEMEDLVPWYRGYRGKITLVDSKKFISEGVLRKNTGKNWSILEVPVDMKLSKLLEHLEFMKNPKSFITDKKSKKTKKATKAKVAKKATKSSEESLVKRLTDYAETNQTGDYEVNIKITPFKDFIPDINTPGNLSILKKSHTNTFCALDANSVPVYYDSAIDILKAFCEARLPWYEKRRSFWLAFNEEKRRIEANRLKYVQAVIDGEIDMSTTEEEIVTYLEENEYHKVFKMPTEDGKWIPNKESSNKTGYDYLLSMQMRSMTKEKVESLKSLIKKYDEKIKSFKKITPEQLWLNDLDDFERAYDHFLKVTVKERDEYIPPLSKVK